ncbi:hypothetical protein EVAR_66968_1 [Eumeta japonica]|uniref:N-acetyltransferase domain-containing protein n=1 Tax=Eumeta variegata TaxID=151549 RepID=A0A4C1ZVF8_EUMVA|nr:hypothetical protein EVAR_66968_1 [Eumeta japonica]
MEEVLVRDATKNDMQEIQQMIQELAEYEGVPTGPQLTVQELVRDSFQVPNPWFFCIVATDGSGVVLGHAMCNKAYSSWTGRAFYIEDIYVKPVARRKGVGLKLISYLCRMAVAEGVGRIDWHVLESNETALNFYRKLGARDLRITEGRAALRLDKQYIEKVASET